MRSSPIKISSADLNGLVALVNSARLDRRVPTASLDALERELSRAVIVDASEMSGDIVTMNSTVWFRELELEELEKYTLVYPAEADVIHDRISILAPIGTALLGYRVGDVVQWQVPSGTRRFEIVEVNQAESGRRLDETAILA